MIDHYVPADFFVLRTPLLAFEEISTLGSELATTSLTPANRVTWMQGRIARLVERPEVREAIFLASPSLEKNLDAWLADPDSPRGEKVEPALVRYLLRAAGRATPFGLFAGCAIGSVATRENPLPTQLQVSAAAQARRHTQLSIEYLDRLCAAVADSAATAVRLRSYLTYRPNPTLYRSAGRLRLFASRLVAGERAYQLSDIHDDEALQTVLRRAQSGALLSQLVSALLDRYDDTPAEEATSYLESLIDSQVLLPDFGPIITGPPPFGTMMAQLARYVARAPASARTPGPLAGLSSTLESVLVKLRALDAQELAVSASVAPSRYAQIIEELRILPVAVPPSRLFRVDVTKPALPPTLGLRVIAQARNAMSILHRALPAEPPKAQRALAHFARAFVERFGEEEVSLLAALDDEAGVAFDREATSANHEGEARFGPREEFLLDRIETAQRQGAIEIALSAQDIDRLAAFRQAAPPPLPDALCVRFAVAAANSEAIAKGDFELCVHRIEGPSGANLIGRFSHAEPGLSEKIRVHLRAEERLRPDALFAEVVHLPAGQPGNILLRPILREHEIALLGRSGAPPNAQLLPDDLFVAVVDDQVVLRSRRLGREVIPRLTTACDPSDVRNLGVYRFLAALQGQGVATSVSWQWGALSRLGFLPRIVYGQGQSRLVLSRARWQLRHADLKPLAGDRPSRAAHLARLRKERAWPRFITLDDAGSELPIDLDNPLCVDSLAQLLAPRQQASIVELFPPPDRLAASGPDGHYVHEVVLPFVRSVTVPPLPVAPPASVGTPRESVALPGSSWLFGELRTGPGIADRLLGETIAPLMDQLLRGGVIKRWFFTRGSAPDFQLRLYMHGPPEALAAAVSTWQEVMAPLIAAGSVFGLAWRSYRRETDRYGGPSSAALCERIFQADSESVLALISQLYEDEGRVRRFRLALLGVDRLLDDLDCDLPTKARLVQRARDAQPRPHTRSDAQKLSQRYRAERAELEAVLYPQREPPIWLQEGLAILHERSTAIASVLDDLRALEHKGTLQRPLESLALELVHLYLNRLLRGDDAGQEYRLYDALSRLYARRLRRSG